MLIRNIFKVLKLQNQMIIDTISILFILNSFSFTIIIDYSNFFISFIYLSMSTSLHNSRYLDPKNLIYQARKHSPKPYLSPSPATASKFSDNSPYKSKTLSNRPNAPSH